VGASSGIGESLIQTFKDQKAKKIVISARRENLLLDLQSQHGKDIIEVEKFDLLNLLDEHKQYRTKIVNIIKANDIDIIVLNSGITQRAYSLKLDLDVLTTLLDVNTTSQIEFIQTATK